MLKLRSLLFCLFVSVTVPCTGFETVQIPSLGGSFVDVSDINDRNVVVGTSSIVESTSPFHAFSYNLETGVLTDLHPDTSEIDSFGMGINQKNDLVGSYGNPDPLHAIEIRQKSKKGFDLGLSGPILINQTVFIPIQSQAKRIAKKGFISGTQTCFDSSSNERMRPMFYSLHSGMIDIGTPAGTENADVNDMNFKGTIVGYSFAALENAPAFATIWYMNTHSSPNTVKSVELITGLPADTVQSSALAINDNGRVVGNYQTPDGTFHAFFWSPEGGFLGLGSPGNKSGNAMAQAINDHHVVAGTFIDAQNVQHVFAWTEKTSMVEIGGALPVGQYSVRKINNKGVVIVSVTDSNQSFAIFTHNLSSHG